MLNQLNGTASPRSSAVSSPVPNGQGGVDLGPLPQVDQQLYHDRPELLVQYRVNSLFTTKTFEFEELTI